MGDIKAAGVVGGVIAYGLHPFEIYAKVDKTIDGSEGLTATIGASVSHKVDQFVLGADLSATWADDKHMKSYFGVTSAQSARSGLRRFDAKSGFKRVDASASVTYLLTENWSITGAGGVGFLLGDAKDSPRRRRIFSHLRWWASLTRSEPRAGGMRGHGCALRHVPNEERRPCPHASSPCEAPQSVSQGPRCFAERAAGSSVPL